MLKTSLLDHLDKCMMIINQAKIFLNYQIIHLLVVIKQTGIRKKIPVKYNFPKSHAFLNSCYANMDDKQKVQGEQFVLINQLDAKNRSVSNGDGKGLQ